MTEVDTQNIYEMIREMIVSDQIPSDKKVNQKKLAEQLGVSRTPVVKALHMLEAEGLLDQVRNVGFFIHKVTLGEILDLLQLRAGLESVAAYDVAERGDDKVLKALIDIMDPFLDMHENEIDRKKYQQADLMFHSELMKACNNDWLTKINDTVRIVEHPFALGMLRDVGEIHAEHAEIVEALRGRDAFAAQRAAAEHIFNTRNSLRDAALKIEQMGMEASSLWKQVKNTSNKSSKKA